MMTSADISTALANTFVIIPMLNEEQSITHVLNDLPTVREVVVVDNGCTDQSPELARKSGATVIQEPQRGYGKACLTGIQYVTEKVGADTDSILIAFVDGDYSDHPDELIQLVQPICEENKDFVIGSRATGEREAGAMHFQALFGNWLACTLMRLLWGAKFTDLGPFRVIRFPALQQLQMQDENYGWTIEMQIKAVRNGLACFEIPVSYRRRIGVSKISGTISGTFKAGYKILFTIFKYRFLK